MLNNPVFFTDPTGLFVIPIPVPSFRPSQSPNPMFDIGPSFLPTLPTPQLPSFPADNPIPQVLWDAGSSGMDVVRDTIFFPSNVVRGIQGLITGSSANDVANTVLPSAVPPPAPDVRITTDNHLLPTGDENSILRRVDPNNPNRVIGDRHYGPDGRATHDIHYTDHGNPKLHPHVPHIHEWSWANPTRPRPSPGRPMP